MHFGTVARYVVKPGGVEQFKERLAEFEGSQVAGWIYTTVFQSTTNPDEVWLSTVFESEEAYRKNAESPEMNSRYTEMRALLAADPDWHDGNVIHEAMRRA